MGVIGNSHPQKGPPMRIGSNPLRNEEAPKHLPAEIAAVITYLPNLEDEILFREFKSDIGLYLNTEFFYTGGGIL